MKLDVKKLNIYRKAISFCEPTTMPYFGINNILPSAISIIPTPYYSTYMITTLKALKGTLSHIRN